MTLSPKVPSLDPRLASVGRPSWVPDSWKQKRTGMIHTSLSLDKPTLLKYKNSTSSDTCVFDDDGVLKYVNIYCFIWADQNQVLVHSRLRYSNQHICVRAEDFNCKYRVSVCPFMVTNTATILQCQISVWKYVDILQLYIII